MFPINFFSDYLHYVSIFQQKIDLTFASILFFSIYNNDLWTIRDILKCIMYADDTTIYLNTEDFPTDNLAKHINWIK